MSLAARLAAGLGAPAAAALLAGDNDRRGEDFADAAVLVAVTDRPEPGVILTQRAENLRRHPGQIAFPGGRIDAADRDAVAAALREAEEEVALAPAAVEIVGIADRYRTRTGFDIVPVVGVIAPDLPLVAAEAEVASVFEVPLAFVLDAANQVEAVVDWEGSRRRFYEIRWGERHIWGATAGIIVNLARRLRWS